MTSMVSGTHQPVINKTFSNLREKMVELTREIKKTEEQTQSAKMASRDIFARERIAVDKQYVLRDKMLEIDVQIDKVETKVEWLKERHFVAQRRYEENLNMCQTLEDHKIEVPVYDERMENIKNRYTTIINNSAEKNRKIDILKAKISATEKRELKAKMRLDHFEEIIRSKDQMRRIESTNYKPKSDAEYLDKIQELKVRLSDVVRKFQHGESSQKELERKEIEIEAQIQHIKKKILSVKQTQNEMLGSRM